MQFEKFALLRVCNVFMFCLVAHTCAPLVGTSLDPKENTLPETNIAPENWWLEDELPFGMAYCQGLC